MRLSSPNPSKGGELLPFGKVGMGFGNERWLSPLERGRGVFF